MYVYRDTEVGQGKYGIANHKDVKARHNGTWGQGIFCRYTPETWAKTSDVTLEPGEGPIEVRITK